LFIATPEASAEGTPTRGSATQEAASFDETGPAGGLPSSTCEALGAVALVSIDGRAVA
jgi:hypothetical protein